MKPLDPRLLKYVRAARNYITLTAITGFVQAALIIAQVVLIGYAIAPVIAAGASFSSRLPIIAALAIVMSARMALTFVHERYAHRAADRVVADLRSQVLTHVVAAGPRAELPEGNNTLTLLSQGLEDLRPYFVRYIPQLLLAATVTPTAVATMVWFDWIAGVLVIGTIPLIPLFMALVGWMTESYSTSRLAQMRTLNAEVMDLLAGLGTLRGFGRERGPIARVKQLAGAYTRVTMQTLKVAFLSGAVLEFLTTLSVALVAVTVGMRLVYDNVALLPALIVIMLAPEVFQPLRQVGAHFHASADGVAAANAAFAILATPLVPSGTKTLSSAPEAPVSIRFDDLTVRAVSRGVDAPANLCGTAKPGEITALVGPSGAGKTTAVMALLGLVEPHRGAVVIDEEHTAIELEKTAWHARCTWVPQRPAVLPGTVLDQFNLTEVSPELEQAALATGFHEVIAALPERWQTRLGHGGLGLSVGQRQRLALTRALIAPSAVMIFDEPSAHLDAASEQAVLTTLQRLRAAGKTVIVVAHRASLVARADAVIAVENRALKQVSADA